MANNTRTLSKNYGPYIYHVYMLSDQDKKEVRKLNQKFDWTFSTPQLRQIYYRHLHARLQADSDFEHSKEYGRKIYELIDLGKQERRMARVEARLEDAGFNELNKRLKCGNYPAALDWINYKG